MLLGVDLSDDQAEMEISIMARKLPIDKYVFDKKYVPFWKFHQWTYHWLYKTETESDICILIRVEKGG